MFESTAWLIYAYLVVGNVVEGFIFLSIMGGFAIGAYGLFVLLNGMDTDAVSVFKKWGKTYLWFLIPAVLLGSLYPSTDDIKLILGGATVLGVGTAAANIEGVEKLPKNLVDAANTFLEGIKEGTTSE